MAQQNEFPLSLVIRAVDRTTKQATRLRAAIERSERQLKSGKPTPEPRAAPTAPDREHHGFPFDVTVETFLGRSSRFKI